MDDGSTDSTAEIAREYPFRLITTKNRGLSSARNTGFQAATGEIVAYIDDDAYPTSEWLKYLATTFTTTDHAAVGGPNLSPPTDGFVADCVAHAPGGPIHVLLSDREAEHIPGCNMAIRKIVWKQSEVSMRFFELRVMTSMSAGACSNTDGHWDSMLRP